MTIKAIAKAAGIVGSQAKLARIIGASPMSVSHWMRRGIPRRWCVPVEDATQGQVTRHDLRPDIFGPPPSTPHPKNPATAACREAGGDVIQQDGATAPEIGQDEAA